MGRKPNISLQKSLFNKSLIANNAQALQYANQFLEMCLARGKWYNLPKTVNERYLEYTLCSKGSAVFFKDDVLGFLALPFYCKAPLSVYGDPLTLTAYSDNNGYRQDLNIDECIIIYNNYTRTSNIPDIITYSERLYDYDCTIDVNVRAQKTPILIVCDESERLSMVNLYQKIDGNQPAILCKKSINRDNLQALRTEAPFIGDRVQNLRNNIWNEALTSLGIPNTFNSKKERLISHEITTALGGVIAVRNSAEKMRQNAAKEINEKFGLNISYSFDLLDTNNIKEDKVIEETNIESEVEEVE